MDGGKRVERVETVPTAGALASRKMSGTFEILRRYLLYEIDFNGVPYTQFANILESAYQGSPSGKHGITNRPDTHFTECASPSYAT